MLKLKLVFILLNEPFTSIKPFAKPLFNESDQKLFIKKTEASINSIFKSEYIFKKSIFPLMVTSDEPIPKVIGLVISSELSKKDTPPAIEASLPLNNCDSLISTFKSTDEIVDSVNSPSARINPERFVSLESINH